MAILPTIGSWGGIAGSNIYIKSQAPKYPTGFGTGLGMTMVGIIVVYLVRLSFARDNVQRRRMLDAEGEEGVRARYTEQELLDMGDRSPFFIYTL